MAETFLRIVPGKFNDQPVRIDVTHPLWAASVAPESFAAKIVAPEPVVAPEKVVTRRRRADTE